MSIPERMLSPAEERERKGRREREIEDGSARYQRERAEYSSVILRHIGVIAERKGAPPEVSAQVVDNLMKIEPDPEKVKDNREMIEKEFDKVMGVK